MGNPGYAYNEIMGKSSAGASTLICRSLYEKYIPNNKKGHRNVIVNYCKTNFENSFNVVLGCSDENNIVAVNCKFCKHVVTAGYVDILLSTITLGLWLFIGIINCIVQQRNKKEKRALRGITEASAVLHSQYNFEKPPEYYRDGEKLVYDYRGQWLEVCDISLETTLQQYPEKRGSTYAVVPL